jgi:hypothetical protein
VTIANNASEGIEIVANGGEMLLEYEHTIFADNGVRNLRARGSNLPDLTIRSLGHNLLDDTPAGDADHAAVAGDLRNTNPLLAALADNGAPTPTHALLAGSPAIDAGDPAFSAPPLFDQRGVGFGRLQGGRIDIGALEVQVSSADFDADGDFDGSDFLAWQRGFGIES